MTHPFSTFCDDFYVNMRLGSQLAAAARPRHPAALLRADAEGVPDPDPVPQERRRHEYNLEEDRSRPRYRWVSLEQQRLTSGHVNPASVEEALRLHSLLLDMAPHHLGISPLEIDYLDVLFGFDLDVRRQPRRDHRREPVPREPAHLPDWRRRAPRPVDFQPTVTVALSDDCRLQARIDVVTRTNSYQVRTGDYADDVISVYLIIRRYWGDRPKEPMDADVRQDGRAGRGAVPRRTSCPQILKPISAAIASRS